MYFKGLITGLMLGTAALFAQEKPSENNFLNKDSTMTTELEEIVVNAEKNNVEMPETIESRNATLYYNDANKIAMSEYSGVFSIVPIYAKFRINNMDPKFVVVSYQDIPLLMNATQLHGGLSVVNSKIFWIDIDKTAYSAQYPAVGSALKLVPKKFDKLVFNVNSDLIERGGLFSYGANILKSDFRTTTAFRNIGIIPFLEGVVPELKILPDIYETINHTTFSKGIYDSEILARISRGNGSFYDKEEGVTLAENSKNDFVMTRQSIKLEDRLLASLKFGYERNDIKIKYDFGNEADDIRTYNKNITLAASIDGSNFSAGSRMFFLSNSTLDASTKQQMFDIYGEYKHVIGNMLFEPSMRVIDDGQVWRVSSGITGTYFIENSSFKLGYSHPVNVLIVDNSSGEKNYRLGYLGAQFGDHYLASLNIRGGDISKILRGVIDEIDLSYYHKYFNANKNEGGADKGRVYGFDLMIRNFGDINYTIKYSTGKAFLGDERMNESVEDIFTADLSVPIIDIISMNAQYMYNGGYTVRVKSDNSNHIVGKAQYVSIGATLKINAWGSEISLSTVGSNLLGIFKYHHVPELARYKIGDTVKSVSMPTLGNIVLSITKEF